MNKDFKKILICFMICISIFLLVGCNKSSPNNPDEQIQIKTFMGKPHTGGYEHGVDDGVNDWLIKYKEHIEVISIEQSAYAGSSSSTVIITIVYKCKNSEVSKDVQ